MKLKSLSSVLRSNLIYYAEFSNKAWQSALSHEILLLLRGTIFQHLTKILYFCLQVPKIPQLPLHFINILRTFLQGIHQKDIKHDFQSRSNLDIEWMDYENYGHSLIVMVQQEFLVHHSGTWYSYQRPKNSIACTAFCDRNNLFWTAVQFNENGMLIFCQLTSTQMICSEIQIPIETRTPSKVVIKSSQDGKFQAISQGYIY